MSGPGSDSTFSDPAMPQAAAASQGKAVAQPRGVQIPEDAFLAEVQDTFEPVKELLVLKEDPLEDYRDKTLWQQFLTALFWCFPVLGWVTSYKHQFLTGDIIAGLTISSFAIPQSIGYATSILDIPAATGLFSSFSPPLVYAILGTSRDVGIGPSGTTTLSLRNFIDLYVDPDTNPNGFLNLVFTSTFFAGVFQLGLGLLRLGFLLDYLSHATLVGFMGGSAITICLNQLKGLLGYDDFTAGTDIVTVLSYVFSHTYEFNWRALVMGLSFLAFQLGLKFLAWWFKGKKPWGRVFFFANILGPLVSVIVATLSVWLTQSQNVLPCVSAIPRGISDITTDQLLLLTPESAGPGAIVGLVVGLIGIMQGHAIARTFAAVKGYHLDPSKEMIAHGMMNIVGSTLHGFVTTATFSLSAINYNCGCHSMLTNVIMGIVVLIVFYTITVVFTFFPYAALSAIIICAVSILLDVGAMWNVWKADKLDFLVMMGTFLGIIFESVEVGLLIGIGLSIFKMLVLMTRPRLAVLGEIPGAPSGVFCAIDQYSNAQTTDGILLLRIDGPLYFANSEFIRSRIMWKASNYLKHHNEPLSHVIIDFSAVVDIDTTGIHSLWEIHRVLQGMEVEVGICNPTRIVLRKLATTGLVEDLGKKNIFLSVNEAFRVFEMERMANKRETEQDAMYITDV